MEESIVLGFYIVSILLIMFYIISVLTVYGHMNLVLNRMAEVKEHDQWNSNSLKFAALALSLGPILFVNFCINDIGEPIWYRRLCFEIFKRKKDPLAYQIVDSEVPNMIIGSIGNSLKDKWETL